jgi:hypothetical protein
LTNIAPASLRVIPSAETGDEKVEMANGIRIQKGSRKSFDSYFSE